jgi:hypothetical protein
MKRMRYALVGISLFTSITAASTPNAVQLSPGGLACLTESEVLPSQALGGFDGCAGSCAPLSSCPTNATQGCYPPPGPFCGDNCYFIFCYFDE